MSVCVCACLCVCVCVRSRVCVCLRDCSSMIEMSSLPTSSSYRFSSSVDQSQAQVNPGPPELLAQLFWTGASLLESDFPSEYTMALRLLTKVSSLAGIQW